MSAGSSSVRVLTLAEVGPRKFEVVSTGLSYRYTVGADVVLIFDRLRWSRDELHCELTVTCSLAGSQTVNGDVISQASFNVSSDRARAERDARLAKESLTSELPWSRLLEEACQNLLSALRTAHASISLHEVPDENEAASIFKCDGISINLTQTTMFFGLPGSGKSLQAERIGLELVRSGRRVGYIDFEWGPEQHRKRAKQMYGLDFPDLRYVRLDKPLVYEIDSLQRTVINEGWDFAILDSVSFGVSGPLESAEVATAFLQAARQLRIGQILVGHQTKAQDGEKYPFGSVLWYAGARDIYHFRRSGYESNASLVTAVTHRKSNAAALMPPIAIEYNFRDGRIDVRQVDPAAIEDIAPSLPVRQRMRHALQAGPRGIDDLATELDVPENTIRQAVKRDDDAGKRGKVRQFVRLDGDRIGLYERSA
jgi:hypothetical protein